MRTALVGAALIASWTMGDLAHAWFGPSAEAPYELQAGVAAGTEGTANTTAWTWEDARDSVPPDNQATQDGYLFGDTVFHPRPNMYLREEFARQVMGHPQRDDLLAKLQGARVRLRVFTAQVGLWLRLSERQSGRWETVRILVVLEVDGTRYEALQMHPFRNGEKPSPVAQPVREAVGSLVEQILVF